MSIKKNLRIEWKIGIHWLTALRDLLACPFDERAVKILSKFWFARYIPVVIGQVAKNRIVAFSRPYWKLKIYFTNLLIYNGSQLVSNKV